MSVSIADEPHVVALAKALPSRIREIVRSDPSIPFVWTTAVWRAFKEVADENGWVLYPQSRPFKGEFLLDFVLWEPDYGPRIVCESQWQHRFSGIAAIDWAFDKLRCVKGDIKVLIYEWGEEPNGSQPPSAVSGVVVPYLREMALLTAGEAFLLLNVNDTQQWAHWWQPSVSGKPAEVWFRPIPLD